MMGLCVRPGESNDKLWTEALPGGRKENTIIQSKLLCSGSSDPWGLCGRGWWDSRRGQGSGGGSELHSA